VVIINIFIYLDVFLNKNQLLFVQFIEISTLFTATIYTKTAKTKDILKAEYMKAIFNYEVFERNGSICLSFTHSAEPLEHLCKMQIRSKALFTDRSDFTNEELAQFQAELKKCREKNFLKPSQCRSYQMNLISLNVVNYKGVNCKLGR
jgi:hypothetical protein